jgi:antitoxin ParD1/3/4
MGIVLPKELEDLIQEMVASGAYDSPEEVVSEALKLLQNREERMIERNRKLQWLRNAIQQGEQSGDAVELDFDAFLATLRARRASSKAET